jgi:hypothetical protein
MKIVYEYGMMFVIHPSGHVDVYDKDSIEAQKIQQQKSMVMLEDDINLLDEQLVEISKTVSGLEAEPVKEGMITAFIRRLTDAFR